MRKSDSFTVFVSNERKGSQYSSVPTYMLVVHNIALYRLGGVQDNFDRFCMFPINHSGDGAQYDVVSLTVCVCQCLGTLMAEQIDVRSQNLVLGLTLLISRS